MTRFFGITLSVVMGIFTTAIAHAAEQNAVVSITSIRSHTSKHSNSYVVNTSVVYVSGATLTNNCVNVWLPTANSSSVEANSAPTSVLMAALLAGKQVRIFYRDELKSPWNDNTICALTAAEIIR